MSTDPQPAALVVFAHLVLAVVLAWAYFQRCRMTRPPIGVYTLGDVMVLMAFIVLIPIIYVSAIGGLVVALLMLSSTSLLYMTFEPLFKRPVAIWLATLALAIADIGLAMRSGTSHASFLAVNNLVLVISVVGAANLWAQSGMRARHAAILGAFLIVFDYVATSALPLMGDMMNRLAGLPFAPILAWPVGASGQTVGLGLGDTLLAAVFPIVMRKAYSRLAGLLALWLGLAAVGTLFVALYLVPKVPVFPVMVLLGPLMIAQYVFWHRRVGPERTTRQYLEAGGR